jgi:hypothetical protein
MIDREPGESPRRVTSRLGRRRPPDRRAIGSQGRSGLPPRVDKHVRSPMSWPQPRPAGLKWRPARWRRVARQTSLCRPVQNVRARRSRNQSPPPQRLFARARRCTRLSGHPEAEHPGDTASAPFRAHRRRRCAGCAHSDQRCDRVPSEGRRCRRACACRLPPSRPPLVATPPYAAECAADFADRLFASGQLYDPPPKGGTAEVLGLTWKN